MRPFFSTTIKNPSCLFSCLFQIILFISRIVTHEMCSMFLTYVRKFFFICENSNEIDEESKQKTFKCINDRNPFGYFSHNNAPHYHQ